MINSNQIRVSLQSKVEAIRRLKLRAALQHYGVEFDRNGFARCPFHREKTASFKIHNNKYKCFGCGVSGDLIDFVMHKFELSFPAAVDAICRDFGIDARPTVADLRRQDEVKILKSKRKKQYRKLLEDKLELHEMYLQAFELCESAAQLPAGKSPSNQLYVDALFCKQELEFLLEFAEADCIDFAQSHPDALPIAPTVPDWPVLKWNRDAQSEINRRKPVRKDKIRYIFR